MMKHNKIACAIIWWDEHGRYRYEDTINGILLGEFMIWLLGSMIYLAICSHGHNSFDWYLVSYWVVILTGNAGVAFLLIFYYSVGFITSRLSKLWNRLKIAIKVWARMNC